MKIETLIIKSPVYKTYIEDFTAYVNQIGYTKNTKSQMPRSLKEFLYWLESQEIDNIENVKPTHIKAFSYHLQTRPSNRVNAEKISQSHQSSILLHIRNFFRYLQANLAINNNPFDVLRFPKAKADSRQALTRLEINQLYEACETLRDRAFLGIYYGCGLRLSEGVALKVADISFTDGVLYVREGKGRRRRAVPMSSKVANDLMSYYRLERPKSFDNGFILNKHKRSGQSWPQNRIKYLVEKAGLPNYYSLHYLRHSIATHLLENGLKIEQVGDFLGHICLDSTKGYTKISSHQLRNNF